MKIMIFGANGGIGKWAVKHALQNGHNVTAYVRDSSKIFNQDKNLTVVQGELTDEKKDNGSDGRARCRYLVC